MLQFRYPFFTEMLRYVLAKYVFTLSDGEAGREDEQLVKRKQPHVHLTHYELFGLKEIVMFLYDLPPHSKNVPERIKDPVQLIGVAEQGDKNVQIETLKRVIKLLLNGERLPGLLMAIIRFAMQSQKHTIKKMLLIFWEIVLKILPEGKLLQEMIIVWKVKCFALISLKFSCI